jgi:benzoyl-CoA reductase subunit C
MNDHSDPAKHVLEHAERLAEDLTFSAVREHKENNPDSLAVGHLPIYTPRCLFEAIGCLPVAVFGGGDQLDIIRGDSYFQSYICHIPRSTIELGVGGHLDVLDAMVFPSICDVIRNLGGMWKLLFPERLSIYLDLPQNFDPQIGGRFYAGELRRIARELEARGAKPLDDDALRHAIVEENTRRQAIADLDALRRAEPWRVSASEAYLIVRAGSQLFARDHTTLIREFIDAVRDRDARLYDNVRVVLRGAFCEQPPIALIRSLERAGCDIVDDDFQLGMRTLDGPVDLEGDPIEALAGAYLTQGRAMASRYVADDSKGDDLISLVKESGADGVIFAAASFCDPALLDQPMIEGALRREGIPFTSFKYAENTGQFHVIREQAGAFSDAVKLWGNQV